MSTDGIIGKLRELSFHQCAKCWKQIDAGAFGGRLDRATRLTVRCHGMTMTADVPDSVVEDRRLLFWFDGVEGKPWEDPRIAKRRAELQAELAGQHAKQGAGPLRAFDSTERGPLGPGS